MNYSLLMPFFGLLNAAVVLLIVVAVYIRKKQREQRQAIGVAWLQSLRVLLSHIQQHRGLSTGYLNGSHELMGQIHEVQGAISRDIKTVAALDDWMEHNSRWESITQHWARLSGRFQNNDVDNNLTQHNKLIQNMLYLIDDMAHDHDLLLLKSYNEKPLHFAWRDLLTAAECIGQARAIGTGVVAAKHCDTVSRIRLNYLCQKIERMTQAAWREMPPSESQKDKLSSLITCINADLIRTKPSISVTDFFHVASSALDGLHEQYDSIVQQLG